MGLILAGIFIVVGLNVGWFHAIVGYIAIGIVVSLIEWE